MKERRRYLIFRDFPHIGQHPEMRSGKPIVLGTGLKVSNVVRTYRSCEGSLDCVQEVHPPLAGKPELIEEAMAFYAAYADLIDPELNETYEDYLARWDEMGYEIGPDGSVRLKDDRRIVEL